MKTFLVLAALFIFAPSTKIPSYSSVKVLPPGITNISYPIILNSGESLIGNPLGSTLRLADGANCPVVIVGGLEEEPINETTDVYISGFSIDGARKTQSVEGWGGEPHSGGKYDHIRNNGITVRRGSKIVIANVDIYSSRSGNVVIEKKSSDVVVIGSKLTDAHFDGLAIYDSKRIFAAGLKIDSNLYAGISIDWKVKDSLFINSSVSSNQKEGIFMRNSSFNRFDGLKMNNNCGPAIFLAKSELPDSGAKHNTFSRISFSGNKSFMQLNDPEDCIGNSFENFDYILEPSLVFNTK